MIAKGKILFNICIYFSDAFLNLILPVKMQYPTKQTYLVEFSLKLFKHIRKLCSSEDCGIKEFIINLQPFYVVLLQNKYNERNARKNKSLFHEYYDYTQFSSIEKKVPSSVFE